MSGFGVYVHFPFCAAKCPYCDFNSHVREKIDETRWRNGIIAELNALASLQETRPLAESVFFGGGTPSLMSGASVDAILSEVARLWGFEQNPEITLEANPNSVEQSRFKEYAQAGVNRVSIGVQALNNDALKFLGRLHGADEARKAIGLAQDIFPRMSFDLIYARPGQSALEWERELREALSFGATHLSLYQLTIEPGTAFATLARTGRLQTPPENDAADLYELTQGMMEAAGLPAYEISNHAKPGDESRHNLIYWRYGDYAGAGPGAHGRLTLGRRRVATQAERLPETWALRVEADGHAITQTEIAREDSAREHLLMNLRLREGIDLDAYETRWDATISRDTVKDLSEAGLISQNGAHLTATPQGRLVLNAVIAALLDERS
jgi:putative oxygen-independent coproporphyrinogen III oxidase